MNKRGKLILISILLLLILNIILILIPNIRHSFINEENNSLNIKIKRISEEIVTQGDVVYYSIESVEMTDFKSSEITILNSLNREVGNAYLVENNEKYDILVDTSLLLTGKYKIKLKTFSGSKISEDSFNVIIIEDTDI